MKRGLMGSQTVMGALNKALNFQYLSPRQADLVHQAACRILLNTGVRVEHPLALERLHGIGADVRKQDQAWRVRLGERHVLEAIASVPKDPVWPGQTPETDFRPGGGRLGFSLMGVNVRIIDPVTRRTRVAVKKDSDHLYRILDMLPLVTTLAETLTVADVNQVISPVASVHSMVKYSTKSILCWPGCLDNCRAIQRLAEVAVGGRENFRNRPFISFAYSPLSPLTLDFDTCAVSMHAAEEGLVSQAMNGALAGATGPASYEGSAAQTLAELWAALVLNQATRKGAKSQLSTFSTSMSMRTGLACLGSPEAALIAATVAQIVQGYGIYGHFGSGTSDSKLPDAQSGYEFAQNSLFLAMSGASMILGMGTLDGGLTFDYAKLLLDHECAANIALMLKGFETSPDELALDVIDDVGPKGSFLPQRHTFARSHRLSDNQFFDRHARGSWENQGSQSAAERAYAKILDYLKNEPSSHLTPSQQTALDEVFEDCVKAYPPAAIPCD